MENHAANSRIRRVITLILLVVLLASLCVGVSLLTVRWMMADQVVYRHDQAHGHQWLHEALGLTEQEAEAIDAFESDYRRERDELMNVFKTRIAELGQLLVEQDRYSNEVNVAIHRIHEVHGQLQELSILHYYDMLGELPAGKQEKLRQLAVEALSEPE